LREAFDGVNFDSVTDQVGNDLSEMKRVSNQLIRYVRFNIVDKVKIVLRSTNNQSLEDPKDSLTERIRYGFHRHATSFDYDFEKTKLVKSIAEKGFKERFAYSSRYPKYHQ